jgi:ABC-type multidrug transport system, ATPase component
MELEIRDLTKNYGKKIALNGFNAVLTPGIYGLLGPNGAGKSTLMNIIADNINADHGEVLFDGVSTIKLGKEFRKILGYMPQQQGLYDNFTALRFLYYIAALKGLNKKQAKEQIDKVLKLVNLTEEAHKKLGSFSGGMKQRILIAQAILNDPKILILDEPTAGLDPKERIRIRNMISEIGFNKIVIIATHVVSDIEYIAKEIIMLKNGHLIEKKPPSELLDSVREKVFEIRDSEDVMKQIEMNYKIGNIAKDKEEVILRVLSDTPPIKYNHRLVNPVLEDVYLYLFDEDGKGS